MMSGLNDQRAPKGQNITDFTESKFNSLSQRSLTSAKD